ncbi:carboxypeptidase-like regulatory domain-containing protein [Paludisphaera soli]|uniref:carboxypeptidase-like regulatory domain-containing protein n=1 Tax=Paludisphaera soli TaxID=2712865 RepID=UPI0013EA8EC4|nr:carboxypeptidase-like regulatory domain-containing protein [Paludisphaera soli]
MKRVPTLAFAWALIAASGCGSGPKFVPVTGTITLNSEPLADVSVMFLPEGSDGSLTAEGMTDSSGKYTLMTRDVPGAAVGKYKAVVTRLGAPGASTDPAFQEDAFMASLSAPAPAKKKGVSKNDPIEYTEDREVVDEPNPVHDIDVKVKAEAAP